MSQFGLMLLMFALVIGLVGLIKFLAWLTELQEQGGIGRAVWRGVNRYAARRGSVNDYPDSMTVVMSRATDEPSRTNERTERTNERTPHDQLWQDFLLDRTRGRLIAVMVDSDLTVTEIRALLKGESAALGQEIEAAKKKLCKAPPEPYCTPIAGRPTDAHYYADAPELEYQPPPR